MHIQAQVLVSLFPQQADENSTPPPTPKKPETVNSFIYVNKATLTYWKIKQQNVSPKLSKSMQFLG